MFHKLAAALAARSPNEAQALEQALARVMTPGETIAKILQDLEKEGRDTGGTQKDVPAMVVSGIARALALLGDASMLEFACGCYGSFRSAPLREVMLAYAKYWATNNEARLGAVVETALPEAGVMVVHLLAKLGTPASVAALERAMKNRELAVRIEALTTLPESREEYVRNEVRAMLMDPTPSVRMKALELVADRGVLAAGGAIVMAVQASDFHSRPLEERALWLRGLATLNVRRAVDLCAQLLKQAPLIPSEALEQTRVLCAEILGECAVGKDAVDACAEASKKRWWNTQAVRDAAERAARDIHARASSGVVEPVPPKRRAQS
jgi:HEAT repeat protein